MSSGVFTILDAMTGDQDTRLVATEQLHRRVMAIGLQNQEENAKALSMGKPIVHPDIRANVGDLSKSHIFWFRHIYRPFVAHAYEYIKTGTKTGSNVKLFSGTNTTNNIRFDLIANNGQFINDMVVHLVIDAVGSSASTIKYKYCDFPGIRVFEQVRFSQGEKIIDEYYTEDTLTHHHLRVPNIKRQAWNRAMGQEESKIGDYYHKDWNTTQSFIYKNGAQTPKPQHERLELWIPLLFWFNLDYRQSFMNSLASSDQKYIDIKLAPLEQIIEARDGTTNAIVALPFSNVNIVTADLYTRNMWLNPKIHDLFVNRSNVGIIRIYQRQKQQCNSSKGKLLMFHDKYLVEQLSFGFRPVVNTTVFTDWWKFSKVLTQDMPIPAVVVNLLVLPINQLVIRTATFKTCQPVVTNLSLTINTNTLYNNYDDTFFNKYLPLMFDDISPPDDCGVYFMPFNLNNGIDPSGYLNFSTARQIYIDYDGRDSSFTSPVVFYATAKTLAMFEYRNGEAGLKYFT